MAARKTTAGRRRTTFEVEAPAGSDVFLAGTFNDWDEKRKPLVDKNGDGVFSGTCLLTKGVHQYKFVINGVWHKDPANPNFVLNDHGTLNSVILVE